MLPTVRISALSDYRLRQQQQQQQQKRRQYVRDASLQDIDDESTTSTGEDSSPQSVTLVDDPGTTVAVSGSTTMCSTDLAALELSPPLTDCSSVGSDDRGIWMTSTLSPPLQQRSRTSNGGGPPITHHHVGGGGGYRPLTARHSTSSSSSNNSFQQRQHHNQKFGGSPEPDDGEVIQRICLVCGDAASGHHYGIASCEACKAFFKRTVQGRIQYSCSADGLCEMTKKRRKSCPACRYEKCLNMGMNPEGIRLDRRKGGRHKHFRSSMDFDHQMDDGSCSEIQDGGGFDSLHNLIATQTANHGENHMLERLMKIEPPKVLAMPDPTVPDSEQKFMTNLSNLADRELVATISWAKLIPGFSSLPLSDEMNMIQNAWNHVLCFNLGYRSATPSYNGYLVFAEDLRVAESESQGVGIWGELDSVSRSIAKKMSELRVTKEEHVLIKAILLLNADVEVENPTAIVTLRDQLFDSLLEYESVHCGTEVFHRVGRLMLLLPLITHQVVLSRQYWLGVKLSGAVTSNRLLSEMVENTLREAFMDEMKDETVN